MASPAPVNTIGRSSARRLAEFAAENSSITGVIAALESCRATADLSQIFGVLGVRLGLFSLDLMDGVPKTQMPSWRDLSAEAIAQFVLEVGFRRLIVLDLADVGVHRGPRTLTLCRKLRAARPDLELITGGGIRDGDDLNHVACSGCDAAMIASALHDGRVTAKELRGVTDAAREANQ